MHAKYDSLLHRRGLLNPWKTFTVSHIFLGESKDFTIRSGKSDFQLLHPSSSLSEPYSAYNGTAILCYGQPYASCLLCISVLSRTHCPDCQWPFHVYLLVSANALTDYLRIVHLSPRSPLFAWFSGNLCVELHSQTASNGWQLLRESISICILHITFV